MRDNSSDRSMAKWAKRWIKAEHWDHRLRVMLGCDQRAVRWHRQNCTLEELAHLWKSYLADSDFAMDESPSTGHSGMGRRM